MFFLGLYYYPFGMGMPDRTQSSESYRFGFNGKENDKEWGDVSSYDYGFRIYNPGLGQFLSVDPHASSYSDVSPYSYVLNNPVNAIDPDGRDVILLVWATAHPRYGHAAIAVSNYRKVVTEHYRTVYTTGPNNDNIRIPVLEKYYVTTYEKDGTYTYYDLWPGKDDNNDGESEGIGRAGPKDMFSGPIAEYQVFDNLTEDDLTKEDPSGAEGYAPDGAIKLFSGYEEDLEAIADIKNYMKSNNNYTSLINNCSDLAACGIAEALDRYKWIVESQSDESTYGLNYTTPNGLYKYVRDRINNNPQEGEELTKPGSVIDNKFEDEVSK